MGTTATPLYQQIYDDLKAAIKGGTYKNGDRIPSEAELSQSYGVSRITVRRAIEDLCSDGFLVKMQGRGTFVGARHISRQLSRTRDISTFTRMCQEIGARPGARVIDRQITPGRPDELEFFGLAEGALMLLVRRVRSADGLPVCDERVILPYDWAPDLLTEPLEDASMFDAIERMLGRRPDHHTVWTINAVKATTHPQRGGLRGRGREARVHRPRLLCGRKVRDRPLARRAVLLARGAAVCVACRLRRRGTARKK